MKTKTVGVDLQQ